MFLSNYGPAQELSLSTTTTQQTCVVGTYNGGSSVCNGDRGAPLFRPTANKVVFGILSFATCAEKIPAVFTVVGYYQSWILEQTGVLGSTTL